MPNRHLTRDERAIRRSAGVPMWRLLPFAMIFVALLVMSDDQQLFRACLGHSIPMLSNKFAVLDRMIGALVCSPYYVRDFSQHWLNISVFCLGAVLSLQQLFWMRRHAAYWQAVRQRERLERAQKTGQPSK